METAQQLDKPSLGNNDAAKDKAINERDAMTQDTPYPDQTVGKPFVDNPKMRLRDVEVFTPITRPSMASAWTSARTKWSR